MSLSNGAVGVPLQCDEPANFRTFRLGLFDLDKLHNIERTLDNLDKTLSGVIEATNVR